MQSLEVHLWCARLDPMDGPGELPPILDDDERRRADAFRFARDRRRFVNAHVLVRHALGWHLDAEPGAIRFRPTDGKPHVEGAEIEFSLSRSDEIAICGVSVAGAAVGVDVERVKPLDDLERLTERILTPDERAGWAGLDATARLARFYDAWTRKEALGKAEGHGILPGPETIRVPLDPLAPGAWTSVDGSTAGAHWLLSAFRPGPETIGHMIVRAPAGVAASGRFADETPGDVPPFVPPRAPGLTVTRVVRRFAPAG